MQSLLLIISFLIHIVALYAIYRLAQQLQSFKKTDNSEIAELFESYLQEIKEENNRLQNELNKGKSVLDSTVKPRAVPNKKIDQEFQKEPNRGTDENYDIPVIDSKVEDVFETSLEAKILQLHQQGMTINEIAQQLDRGKTEVELFIKLHQKK